MKRERTRAVMSRSLVSLGAALALVAFGGVACGGSEASAPSATTATGVGDAGLDGVSVDVHRDPG